MASTYLNRGSDLILRRRRGEVPKQTKHQIYVFIVLMGLTLVVFFLGFVSLLMEQTEVVPSSSIAGDSNSLREKRNPIQDLKSIFPYFGSSSLDTKNYTPLGGGRFDEWQHGDTPYPITQPVVDASNDLARQRRTAIKAAMNHAWSGYRKYAFGYDELQPVSGRGNMHWKGVGTTLVDSLDTLWLMGMKDEFYECRDWVRDHLSHDVSGYVSVFENTIRSLGGLLSAYGWSGDEAFLEKAVDLGDRLVKAFDSPSGIPWHVINLKTGQTKNMDFTRKETSVAAAGSLQIEFRYLSKITKNNTYAEKAEHAFDLLSNLKPPDGLYYTAVRNTRSVVEFGRAGSRITFGGRADSFYEYMLKLWLQGGKTESKYREMYDESIEGMHKVLLQYSVPSGLAYLAKKSKYRSKILVHEFEHLECFMGGTKNMDWYIFLHIVEFLINFSLTNSLFLLFRTVSFRSVHRPTWH